MSRQASLAVLLQEKLWRQEPIHDIRICDVHSHLGAWPPAWVHSSDADSMLAAMDRIGVERACISHFAGLGSNFRYGNDQAFTAAQQYPGRFYYYAVINPHYPDQALPELQRCFERGGCIGIKLHANTHNATAGHPGYKPIWEYANDHHLLALCHGSTAEELDMLSSRWLNISFINAHGAAADPPAESLINDLYCDRQNVYADTAGSMPPRGAMDRFVESIPAEKILFGSDFPLMDLGCQLGRLLWSHMDDESLCLILGENFLRLMAQIPGYY